MANTWLPFNNMNDYLKTIVIIEKLYCKTKKNYKQVNACVDIMVCVTPENEIINFVQRVITYPYQFPIKFIKDLDAFKKSLTDFCIGNNDQSIVIESPASNCSYCGHIENLTNWYEYKCPPFCKDVMLFTLDKIGKIY